MLSGRRHRPRIYRTSESPEEKADAKSLTSLSVAYCHGCGFFVRFAQRIFLWVSQIFNSGSLEETFNGKKFSGVFSESDQYFNLILAA